PRTAVSTAAASWMASAGRGAGVTAAPRPVRASARSLPSIPPAPVTNHDIVKLQAGGERSEGVETLVRYRGTWGGKGPGVQGAGSRGDVTEGTCGPCPQRGSPTGGEDSPAVLYRRRGPPSTTDFGGGA